MRTPPPPSRLDLFERPSPVRRVEALGLWVKDDGAIGGNKVRKLEHTLADALARGKRTVLTFGGLGSHHALATARACDEVGLGCLLCLVDQPVDAHVLEVQEALARTGARVWRTGGIARTAVVAAGLIARHRPYRLPVGGSSAVGMRGIVAAAQELADQVEAGELPEPRTVVVAVGSGGTAAGLAAGLARTPLRPRILGVLVNDRTRVDVAAMARRAARGGPPPLAVEVVRDFLGAGYGHATPEGDAALQAARAAGLELEPVYTAKAMAAARTSGPDAPVLFWHTYGGCGPHRPERRAG